MNKPTDKHDLKHMSMLAWQVTNGQRQRQEENIAHILQSRPRQRDNGHRHS